ncbi:hypothetical protein [Caballeronia humi]|uniref:Lipid A palmitoyltransferase PagP n=1 Tax=Caballeronia humi TaxID=326474 RepID=A0A158IE97_9BURK|nr:hypothetical protein [Caballeronia humi]SAL54451.1 hypothetical protein AWB65_04614 [Caballeronia humi]
MRSWLTRSRAPRARAILLAACATLAFASNANAGDWCGNGLWVDAMIGSHHINPDKDFQEFNPGIGVECWIAPEWALTAGYFRNSLSKPSLYGGGVWAPEFAHWGFIRIAAMGGLISGYPYGGWGFGHDHTIGPVIAPLVMLEYRRVGANVILIPPIPSADLPFTIGFQLKVRF